MSSNRRPQGGGSGGGSQVIDEKTPDDGNQEMIEPTDTRPAFQRASRMRHRLDRRSDVLHFGHLFKYLRADHGLVPCLRGWNGNEWYIGLPHPQFKGARVDVTPTENFPERIPADDSAPDAFLRRVMTGCLSAMFRGVRGGHKELHRLQQRRRAWGAGPYTPRGRVVQNPMVLIIPQSRYKNDDRPANRVDCEEHQTVFGSPKWFNYQHVHMMDEPEQAGKTTPEDIQAFVSRHLRTAMLNRQGGGDAEKIDGLVFVMSGHGDENVLGTTSGRSYWLPRLWQHCDTVFEGIPKLYIMNMCRGHASLFSEQDVTEEEMKDFYEYIKADQPNQTTNRDRRPKGVYNAIFSAHDSMLLFATLPGMVSYSPSGTASATDTDRDQDGDGSFETNKSFVQWVARYLRDAFVRQRVYAANPQQWMTVRDVFDQAQQAIAHDLNKQGDGVLPQLEGEFQTPILFKKFGAGGGGGGGGGGAPSGGGGRRMALAPVVVNIRQVALPTGIPPATVEDSGDTDSKSDDPEPPPQRTTTSRKGKHQQRKPRESTTTDRQQPQGSGSGRGKKNKQPQRKPPETTTDRRQPQSSTKPPRKGKKKGLPLFSADLSADDWPQFVNTIKLAPTGPVMCVGGIPSRDDHVRVVNDRGMYGELPWSSLRPLTEEMLDDIDVLAGLYEMLGYHYDRQQQRLFLVNVSRPRDVPKTLMQRPMVILIGVGQYAQQHPNIPTEQLTGTMAALEQLETLFKDKFNFTNVHLAPAQAVAQATALEAWWDNITKREEEPRKGTEWSTQATDSAIVVVAGYCPKMNTSSFLTGDHVLPMVVPQPFDYGHTLWINFPHRAVKNKAKMSGFVSRIPNSTVISIPVFESVLVRDPSQPHEYLGHMVDYLTNLQGAPMFDLEGLWNYLRRSSRAGEPEGWTSKPLDDVIVQMAAKKGVIGDGSVREDAFQAGYRERRHRKRGGYYEEQQDWDHDHHRHRHRGHHDHHNHHDHQDHHDAEADYMERLCQEHLRLKAENRRLKRQVKSVHEATANMMHMVHTQVA